MVGIIEDTTGDVPIQCKLAGSSRRANRFGKFTAQLKIRLDQQTSSVCQGANLSTEGALRADQFIIMAGMHQCAYAFMASCGPNRRRKTTQLMEMHDTRLLFR